MRKPQSEKAPAAEQSALHRQTKLAREEEDSHPRNCQRQDLGPGEGRIRRK